MELAGRLDDQIKWPRLTGKDIDGVFHSINPEAVDHVGGGEFEPHIRSSGKVQYVAGLDAERRVIEFPPPLMRDRLDRERRPSVAAEDSSDKITPAQMHARPARAATNGRDDFMRVPPGR